MSKNTHKHKWLKWFIPLLTITVVAGAGCAVYFTLFNKSKPKPDTSILIERLTPDDNVLAVKGQDSVQSSTIKVTTQITSSLHVSLASSVAETDPDKILEIQQSDIDKELWVLSFKSEYPPEFTDFYLTLFFYGENKNIKSNNLNYEIKKNNQLIDVGQIISNPVWTNTDFYEIPSSNQILYLIKTRYDDTFPDIASHLSLADIPSSSGAKIEAKPGDSVYSGNIDISYTMHSKIDLATAFVNSSNSNINNLQFLNRPTVSDLMDVINPIIKIIPMWTAMDITIDASTINFAPGGPNGEYAYSGEYTMNYTII